MIGWMRGELVAKAPPSLLLDVQGVGYELEAPMTTFYDLPEPGEAVVLHCHHLVREDAHHLYGFIRQQDRDVFRILLKVNGVGAKLALGILSGLDAASLQRAIVEADTVTLSKLPGIGKRTAERLIVELRDRVQGWSVDGASAVVLPSGGASAAPAPSDDPVAEAVNALIALGLKPPEASRRVHAVDAGGLPCEEIVRRALQTMVR